MRPYFYNLPNSIVEVYISTEEKKREGAEADSSKTGLITISICDFQTYMVLHVMYIRIFKTVGYGWGGGGEKNRKRTYAVLLQNSQHQRKTENKHSDNTKSHKNNRLHND